ncbi:hypothetical protein [Malikia sp.]|uniref:hypothetical protein n=1 Tax=Malikia sp. TaxID=2070706 RepID=UPI0026069BC4|nr:hypothetical protein [Malikia sp.]MDD2728806.1 hypothetical protein [Malikia sp.]
MKQVETRAQLERSPRILSSSFSGLVLGLGLALGAAGAQAGDVYWSLGMQSPGVVIGASNAAPVYVAPAPVVVYPAPRVMAPPVYGAAWAPPGHYQRKHHKHHWKHDHHGWEGRGGWDDDGRRGHGRY